MSRAPPTSAFYTFDPIAVDLIELVPPIQASMGGDHLELISMCPLSTDIQSLRQGEEAPFDPATLLYLASGDWGPEGGMAEPLDSMATREKLGRFPCDDGNVISYLMSFTRQRGDMASLHELLAKLGDGLSEENLGEPGFRDGFGGMSLLGWINALEVSELRSSIRSDRWTTLGDEPLDGGVDFGFRHLLSILRSAEKRGCGILMRKHS
ncbi:MAG: hypothetical protein CMB53_00125 [Euryarchaeota archaeon]|nr:hypothetical protein [Euryarchaeota archaeon]|tara:strand:- start:7792 stop:8418 length:627 start_codon:yes stop_codon:yes gene_type:complete